MPPGGGGDAFVAAQNVAEPPQWPVLTGESQDGRGGERGLFGETEGTVVMMASDWIPSEPIPAESGVDERVLRLQEERLEGMVPKWAGESAASREWPMTTIFYDREGENPLR